MLSKNKRKIILTFFLLVNIVLLTLHISDDHNVVVSGGVDKIAFINGQVITMEDDNPTAEAVITENGFILEVGTNEEINGLIDGNTQVIDLDGRTLLPGFIDSHSHWLGDVGTDEEVIEHLIRNGYTTVCELFGDPDRIAEVTNFDSTNGIRVRVNFYLRLNWGNWGEGNDVYVEWYKAYAPGQMLAEKVRIAGVKIFIDGVMSTRTLALREPYANDPSNYGVLFWEDEELNNLVMEAHEGGFQIAAHAMGDAAIEQILNAYELALDGESNAVARHRVEHVSILPDDLLERFSDLGIIASIQADWYNSDVEITSDWNDNIGLNRVKYNGRIRDLLDMGVPTTINTDGPYCYRGKPSIYQLYTSVTRMGARWYYPLPDWEAAQRINVDEALRLMTLDSAYAIGQEEVMGSIKLGKYADLIVLTDNPMEIDPEELLDLHVWLTMIDGKIEYWEEIHETYTLDINVKGDGSTTNPPGIYYYAPGYHVETMAIPWTYDGADGKFKHWLLNDVQYDGETISVNMDQDINLTAVFKELGAETHEPTIDELYEELLVDFEDLLSEFESMVNENMELSEVHDSLVSDYEELFDEHDSLVSDYEELEEEAEMLQGEIDILEARIEELENAKSFEIPGFPYIALLTGILISLALPKNRGATH